MSSDFARFGQSSVSERFARVLGDRTASRWANWVGLSQGTLSRLKAGELPDPEKLTAACRAENLSLTWLLDGMGAPYLVNVATDQRDAVGALEELFDDEAWSVLVVAAGEAATIVLHQPASVVLKGGTCDYTATVVLGGCYDAERVLDQLRLFAEFQRPMYYLETTFENRARLATGYMAATELFGWRDAPGGLFGGARIYHPPLSVDQLAMADVRQSEALAFGVRESQADYRDALEAERIFRGLPPDQRSTVLQMLRGLEKP